MTLWHLIQPISEFLNTDWTDRTDFVFEHELRNILSHELSFGYRFFFRILVLDYCSLLTATIRSIRQIRVRKYSYRYRHRYRSIYPSNPSNPYSLKKLIQPKIEIKSKSIQLFWFFFNLVDFPIPWIISYVDTYRLYWQEERL